MSKVKTKKHDTWIDMTAMSDVVVLLLTFFILTSTFIPKEPVQVVTPQSVSEIKIPEANILTVLVSPKGQIFLNLDRPSDKKEVLELIGKDYGITFTDRQIASFINQPQIGVPVSALPKFLDLTVEQQDALLKDGGIPIDSTNNQFKRWVEHARDVNENLTIAVKADQKTPYPLVKEVMGTLQDIKANRFNLVTNLKGMPEGF